MTAPKKSTSQPWLLMFIAVCLVAINMRLTITSIGPLLDEIAADQGVAPAALGFLAAVPLLTWAVVSPLAQGLAARIGLNAAVGWSLAGLTLATIWRSLPGTSLNLWLGTALIGTSLAIANVLLPATIKRDFSARLPLVMGLYSALIGVSGAIGAGMVAPISHHILSDGTTVGWRWALVATAASLPLALLVWVIAAGSSRRGQKKGRVSEAPSAVDSTGSTNSDAAAAALGTAATPVPQKTSASHAARRVWLDPVAWQIALYMGAQSWSFYIYATWISPIDVSRGIDPISAGFSVTIFHIGGMLGSLIGPLLSRGAMGRLLPVILPVTSFIGLCGFVLVPAAPVFWLALCGISSGAGLSVSLTLIAQRSSSIETAGAVSGMVQSFGYLIAGIGPILFGWFFDISGAWGLPLIAAAVGGAAQFSAAIALARERMVFSKR